MTKILKKDIKNICSCIVDLSCQHIKDNEKGCYNHNIITRYYIKPYTCKEVNFLFYKNDYAIIVTADNKKDMYIKLLKLYERGLNNWVEVFEKDDHKTKKEKHRLNVHKKLLLELNMAVDR